MRITKKKTLFASEQQQDVPDVYVVVDGTYYCHRAFHAYKDLKNKDGQITGVLYGFFRFLFHELREHIPPTENVYIVFDGEYGSQPRKKIYKDYKANRGDKNDEIVAPQCYIAELCDALEWRVFQEPFLEGDDIINALANVLGKKGDVYILTRDKDMMACVKKNVYVFDAITKVLYNKKEVEKKWGIPPKKLRLFLSLSGDGSDCIPGVDGIGKKTAVTLCKKYDRHTVLSALSKKQQKQFLLSYKLVKPMITSIKIPKFKRVVSNADAHRILKKYEVKSLINDFHNRNVKKEK